MQHLFIMMIFLLSLDACAMERAADKYPSNLSEQEIVQVLDSVPKTTPGMGEVCVLNPLLKITKNDSPCFINFSDDNSTLWGKDIMLDGEKIAHLKSGEYYCTTLEVGPHILNAKKKDNRKKVEIDTSYKFTISPDELLFLEEYYDEYRPLQSENLNHIVKKLCVEETEQNAYCKEDEYDKTKFCYSPTYEYNDDTYGKTKTYFVVNAKYINSEPCIIVTYSASDWAFIKRATDDSGQNLSLTELRTNVSHGIYETYRIDLPTDYIQKHKNTGIKIKLYGRDSNSYIKLPPEYVQGWLNFLEKNI